MGHVGSDQVSCSQGSTQTELTSQHRGGNDARQLAGVFTRGGGVRSPDTKQVKHSGLRFKDSTTTNGADLDGRHGDGDLEVTIVAVEKIISICGAQYGLNVVWVRRTYFFMVVIQLLLSTFWAGS